MISVPGFLGSLLSFQLVIQPDCDGAFYPVSFSTSSSYAR